MAVGGIITAGGFWINRKLAGAVKYGNSLPGIAYK